MIIARKLSKGFTLLEVIISLVVANIALLGLAAGQLKSLQYSDNSFSYTTSLTHANNVAEIIWSDLCAFEKGTKTFDNTYVTNTLEPTIGNYQLNLVGAGTGIPNRNFQIEMSWVDKRMDNPGDNEIVIAVSYPEVEATCSV